MTNTQASRLAGLWTRLAARHVSLEGGCGCGGMGISVTLEDFERDIADYLWAESERLGEADVVAFLLQPGPIETQEKAVRHILQRIEQGESAEKVADWLLPRLTKTIESFAKLHGSVGDTLP